MAPKAAVSRRELLCGVAGAATATAASTGASAQAAGERPEFGDWLDGVDGGYEDARGRDEVTVAVGASGNDGNFAFSPAGLWVDPETTVRWEWTGEGGVHNVHAVSGAEFTSGDPVDEPGVHFTHTFGEGGIVEYQCDPHTSLGMRGAVAVGDDVPMASGGGGSDGSGGGGSDDGGAGEGSGGQADRPAGAPVLSRHASRPVVIVGSVAIAFMALVVAVVLHMTYTSAGRDRGSGPSGGE